MRAFAVMLLLWGCGGDPRLPRREFMPEMVDSLAYDSFAPNPLTRDGKTLLAPAPGSVPRRSLPARYDAGTEEAFRAGRELMNPIGSPDARAVARGEAVFVSFCAPCHGRSGQGDGPVAMRFPAPPSLLAERARVMPDGQVFHVITHGQGLMPGHGAQILPDDRWRLVAYLRRLQQGGTGSPADGRGLKGPNNEGGPQ